MKLAAGTRRRVSHRCGTALPAGCPAVLPCFPRSVYNRDMRTGTFASAVSEVDTPAAPRTEVKTDAATEEKVQLAPLYKVLIHNDDVTTMEFVVRVLQEIFKKPLQEAVEIMLTAHETGVALVAVLPLEQAELRVDQAKAIARAAKYPLMLTYEPEL
jgi:ATP-dependent Clp protease adaptor protein ClpS